MPQSTILLYLHGFLSSPQSHKAQLTSKYCERNQCVERIIIPTLQWGPNSAIEQLHTIMADILDQHVILIGSSLGGFYATRLAEHYGIPAALVNPAVAPFDRWQEYLGDHQNFYSDAVITVTDAHVAELESLDVKSLANPENYLLLVEQGDETLDYRNAVRKYVQSSQIVHAGGNHSYENYAADLPAIFSFLLSRIP